ncbi:hypothetical protein EV356DRAFT_128677 [Viridothelium virens]|uniref:Cytochrome c oxidase subunit 8, mitochondrial n=1 Tax=Viridothelium virens TaxID=1048519 RepID=A0A6A6HAT2_VIRVR|nr:hypothetical protein EV356DRAFT_128677 [Viridothelium virens]
MLSRTAMRAPTMVARRGFHSTRAQMSSPYHYPEGPRSNIPFNPLTRFFWLRYWGFCAAGFGLPFGVAGNQPTLVLSLYTTNQNPLLQSGKHTRTVEYIRRLVGKAHI